MAELTTKATGDDVDVFLASIEDEGRRGDAVAVCDLIAKAAKAPPCLDVKRLSDVDLAVLRRIIARSVTQARTL